MFVRISPVLSRTAQTVGTGKANLRYISRLYSKEFTDKFKGESLVYNMEGDNLSKDQLRGVFKEINDLTNQYIEEGGDIKFQRFIISPDPTVPYSDEEFHHLARVCMDKMNLARTDDFHALYAIHRDTDADHLHITAFGNKYYVKSDDLNKIKYAAAEHEQYLANFKGIDLDKDSEFNLIPPIRSAISLSHNYPLALGADSILATKNYLNFEKHLEERHEQISNTFQYHDYFDMRSLKLDNVGEKDLFIKLPRMNDVNDRDIRSLLKNAIQDFREHIKGDFDFTINQSERHKGVIADSRPPEFTIRFKSVVKSDLDFTKGELKKLNNLFKNRFSQFGVDQYDANNQIAERRQLNHVKSIASVTRGYKSLAARLTSVELSADIAKQELVQRMRNSIKIEFVKTSTHDRLYRISLPSPSYNGKELFKPSDFDNDQFLSYVHKNINYGLMHGEGSTVKSIAGSPKFVNGFLEFSIKGNLPYGDQSNLIKATANPEFFSLTASSKNIISNAIYQRQINQALGRIDSEKMKSQLFTVISGLSRMNPVINNAIISYRFSKSIFQLSKKMLDSCSGLFKKTKSDISVDDLKYTKAFDEQAKAFKKPVKETADQLSKAGLAASKAVPALQQVSAVLNAASTVAQAAESFQEDHAKTPDLEPSQEQKQEHSLDLEL